MKIITPPENECKTTTQLKRAVYGSLFIWRSLSLSYPRQIAKEIGREDIIVRSLLFIRSMECQSHKYPDVILDHSLVGKLSNDSQQNYNRAKLRSIRFRPERDLLQ